MKFELSIDIPAPREAVWAMAQDPRRRPEWDVRVMHYDIHGRPGPGTPISITLRLFGSRPVVEGEFVRFDPPVQSAIRLDRSSSSMIMIGGGTWAFDEIPGGTRMTTRFVLKPDDRRGSSWIPAWMTRWFVARETRRSLENLKELVLRTREPGK